MLLSTWYGKILIGISSGIIYGLFFLFHEKRVLCFSDNKKTLFFYLHRTIGTAARILLIGLFFGLLLLSTKTELILLLGTFFASFWMIVLRCMV